MSTGEEEIFRMLCDVRKGDGITVNILKHSKRVFHLLRVETAGEAINAIVEASASLPASRPLRAAINALHLAGPPTSLTQRRLSFIATLQAEERAKGPGKLERPAPTTAVGLKDWEDRGFRGIAEVLSRRMSAGEVQLDVGNLNRRLLQLEEELQRERDLSKYRDEKLMSALNETAVLLEVVLDERLSLARVAALSALKALRELYPRDGALVRSLDFTLSARGLFDETTPTSSLSLAEINAQLGSIKRATTQEPAEATAQGDPCHRT